MSRRRCTLFISVARELFQNPSLFLGLDIARSISCSTSTHVRERWWRRCRKKDQLHHDNASTHTSTLTQDYPRRSGVRILSHAPYSPDLSPFNSFLFPKLKASLEGRKFSSENELDRAVNSMFRSLSKDVCFYVPVVAQTVSEVYWPSWWLLWRTLTLSYLNIYSLLFWTGVTALVQPIYWLCIIHQH